MWTTYAVVGLVAALILYTGFQVFAPERTPRTVGQHRLTDDTQAGRKWLTLMSHDAPPNAFTVEQAHEAVQLHRRCSARGCACKYSALTTLIAAGRAKMSTR